MELRPGQSQTVRFTLTAHDLAHWEPAGWTTAPGTYRILVGDSSRNLPLSGSLHVASALWSNVSGTPSRAGSVVVANPRGIPGPLRSP